MSDFKLNFSGADAIIKEYGGLAKIRPSITDCVIKSFSVKKNQNDKPYIAMEVETLDGKARHEEMFFLTTEKAIEFTQARIRQLLEAISGTKVVSDGVDIDEINKKLKGKKIRLLFNGEEYVSRDDKEGDVVRVKTVLAFMDFAESITVPVEETRLRAPFVKKIKEETKTEVEAKDPEISNSTDLAF